MLGQRLNLQVPGEIPEPVAPNPPAVRNPRPVARIIQPPIIQNIPLFNYEYVEFNPEDHARAIKKLKKYTLKGIYHTFYLGDTPLKCKMVPEYGFENIYDEIMSKPEIGLSEMRYIKANYRTMFISSECILKIQKYPELFESVFWNVISRSKITNNKYTADIWYCSSDALNIVPEDPSKIYDILKAYYEKIGIKEITILRAIYFKETFSLLVHKMVEHIGKNLHDSDIMNPIRDTLPEFIGAIMCLYGKQGYDSIINNIDEFLKYTTADCLHTFRNYYMSSTIKQFLQNTHKLGEKIAAYDDY